MAALHEDDLFGGCFQVFIADGAIGEYAILEATMGGLGIIIVG